MTRGRPRIGVSLSFPVTIRLPDELRARIEASEQRQGDGSLAAAARRLIETALAVEEQVPPDPAAAPPPV